MLRILFVLVLTFAVADATAAQKMVFVRADARVISSNEEPAAAFDGASPLVQRDTVGVGFAASLIRLSGDWHFVEPLSAKSRQMSCLPSQWAHPLAPRFWVHRRDLRPFLKKAIDVSSTTGEPLRLQAGSALIVDEPAAEQPAGKACGMTLASSNTSFQFCTDSQVFAVAATLPMDESQAQCVRLQSTRDDNLQGHGAPGFSQCGCPHAEPYDVRAGTVLVSPNGEVRGHVQGRWQLPTDARLHPDAFRHTRGAHHRDFVCFEVEFQEGHSESLCVDGAALLPHQVERLE